MIEKNDNTFHYFKSFMDNINVGVVILDYNNTIIYTNRFLYKFLNNIRERAIKNQLSIKKELENINIVSKRIKYKSLYDLIINDKKYTNKVIELNQKKVINENIYLLINKTRIMINKKLYNVFIFNDITDIKKTEKFLHSQISNLNKKLEYAEILASIDPLTKIYNRYKFYEECNNLINLYNRYGTIFSLIMFDIDNFKRINDTFGHIAGDNVLKEIAFLVSKTIRSTDILFRWGGDEFIILLPNTNLNGSFISAEKIRHMIENSNFDDKKNKIGRITCSFGVSTVKKGFDCDQLTKRIDEAMYNAKKSGKNRVFKI